MDRPLRPSVRQEISPGRKQPSSRPRLSFPHNAPRHPGKILAGLVEVMRGAKHAEVADPVGAAFGQGDGVVDVQVAPLPAAAAVRPVELAAVPGLFHNLAPDSGGGHGATVFPDGGGHHKLIETRTCCDLCRSCAQGKNEYEPGGCRENRTQSGQDG